MIPGDLLSAFPHRQFHTLPGLSDSWAALPNSNPNACMPMQGGSLYHFYDGLWYDPAERRTHDLPCERRTRYRLSQPDTVQWNPSCEPTPFASEKWPFNFKRGGLLSGVEINTFTLRFSLSSGLSRGSGLSSGWPLKRGSTVKCNCKISLLLIETSIGLESNSRFLK